MKAKEVASVNAVLDKHLKAVNELDPGKRKVLFEEVYDPHIHFVGPQGIANGPAELEKLYDGLHKQFPGFIAASMQLHAAVAQLPADCATAKPRFSRVLQLLDRELKMANENEFERSR